MELSGSSSYLSKRTKFVSVNDSTSYHLEVSCEVPQVSVPDPLLFLIYINNLPSVSKVLSFYAFLDTNIFCGSSDLITLQKIKNRELKKV